MNARRQIGQCSFLSLDSKVYERGKKREKGLKKRIFFIRKNKTFILIPFTSKIQSYCFLVGHQDFCLFKYDFHTKVVRISENQWCGSDISPKKKKKKKEARTRLGPVRNLHLKKPPRKFFCEIFNLRHSFLSQNFQPQTFLFFLRNFKSPT